MKITLAIFIKIPINSCEMDTLIGVHTFYRNVMKIGSLISVIIM